MKTLLLVNLGSPKSPEVGDVATYLKQFLMDPYVVDIPYVLRWLLVKGIIVPRRSPLSSEAYKKIWTDEGSPLVAATESLAEKLDKDLAGWRVEWAMRYGEPALEEKVQQLVEEEVEKLYVWPLYPQYAKSTVVTTVEAVKKVLKRSNYGGEVHYVQDFFDAPFFIEAMAEVGREMQQNFHADHFLFSFHGLPESHVTELDESESWCLKESHCCHAITDRNRLCYRAQCFATARALAEEMGLQTYQYTVSFQSRLGSKPWIRPYSDEVVSDLAKRGVKRLMVFSPSFVADCLETLEELQLGLREQFIAEGGEDLILSPSLNDSDRWVSALRKAVEEPLVEWSRVR